MTGAKGAMAICGSILGMSIKVLGMNWRMLFRAMLLGLALVTATFAQAQSGSGGIIVTDSKGTLRIRIGTGDPQVVTKGQAIPLGARIVTGADSYALLTFADGQVVALGANSRLIVREFRYLPNDIDKSRIVLNITDGSVSIVMGAIGQHDPGLVQLQVGTKTTAQTPNLPRGGELALVMLGSATLVQVDQGKVSLRVSGASYPLGTGQSALVSADGFVQLGNLAQLAGGDKAMFDQFQEMLRFKFPHSVQRIMLTFSTPQSGEGSEEDRTRAESLLPLTGTLSTSATGAAGGGGTPRAASPN